MEDTVLKIASEQEGDKQTTKGTHFINVKMKPCPFCGNTEISIHKNLVLSYFAYCTRCNAQGPSVVVYHDYENDGENGERNLAAKRWNERESPIVETEEKKQAAT